MAKKKYKFKDFEVEHDDQALDDDVDITDKHGHMKKGKKVKNPYIEVLGAPGQGIPEFINGTSILTSSNPTCFWYYSGGWHVYCY